MPLAAGVPALRPVRRVPLGAAPERRDERGDGPADRLHGHGEGPVRPAKGIRVGLCALLCISSGRASVYLRFSVWLSCVHREPLKSSSVIITRILLSYKSVLGLRVWKEKTQTQAEIPRLTSVARRWRKWSLRALLVGVQCGTATVGNQMESPQKIKNKLMPDPVMQLLGICPKEPMN